MAVSSQGFEFNKFGFDRQDLISLGREFVTRTADSFRLSFSEEEYSDRENTLHQAKSESYLLKSIDDVDYKLIGNITIDIEYSDEGEVVASDPLLNLYGIGDSGEDAVNEYVSMLVDLYDELSSSEDILSRHLLLQLEYLRSILSRK